MYNILQTAHHELNFRQQRTVRMVPTGLLGLVTCAGRTAVSDAALLGVNASMESQANAKSSCCLAPCLRGQALCQK